MSSLHAEADTLSMQPFPETLIGAGFAIAGATGLLIVIAPTFGCKPKATADGWSFPVKPTCLLLYTLALCGGACAVAYSGFELLSKGTSLWTGWVGFAAGFLLVPMILADWPEPLVLDDEGLAESGSPAGRLRWQEMRYIRAYRTRCDRGVVVEGSSGKRLVIAAVAYDTEAVLNCVLQCHPLPYYSRRGKPQAPSILASRHTQ